jgi:hypothetical protein
MTELLGRLLAGLGAKNAEQVLRSTAPSSLEIGPDEEILGGKFGFLSGVPGETEETRAEPVEAQSAEAQAQSPSASSGHVEATPAEPVEAQSPETETQGPSTGSGHEDPPEKTLEELLAELDELIGLADVKAEIHRQVAVLRVEGLRTKAGLRSPTITRHLVFVGNPGTGKTTVARLVGGIYRALGLLSKGQLVEVDRSELVAGYLGQTAIKTAEVVAKAAGGVLFIDEAYSLAGDQYGSEATDTLVKEMEDRRNDLVLIVAGYPDPMVGFIAQNPGLASRFRTTIEFADYSDPELISIFTGLAATADYDIPDDTRRRFEAILLTTPRGPLFGNGRFARNQLEAAIGRHAWRLRDVAEPTLEQLRELLPEDLDDQTRAEPVEAQPKPTPAEPTEGQPEPTRAEPVEAQSPETRAEPVEAQSTPSPSTSSGHDVGAGSRHVNEGDPGVAE